MKNKQSNITKATPFLTSLRRYISRGTGISLLSLAISCQAGHDISRPLDYGVLDTIRMGQGFHSLGGASYSREMAYCADDAPLKSLGGSTGESVIFYVASAKSEKSLQEELAKSLTLGLEYGSGNQSNAAGSSQSVNEFTGKLEFSSKREAQSIFREKSVYVIVRARKTFSTESLSSFKIAPNIVGFFADRTQEFFSRCGDRFVSGVKKGAEITAYMRCDTESQESKDKIANTVNASGGLYGVSAKSTIEDMLAKVRHEAGEKCTYISMSRGGSGTIRTESDQKFIDSALEYLGSATPATAVPIEIVTMPYTSILDRDLHDSILSKIDLALVSQRQYVKQKEEAMALLSGEVSRLLDVGINNPNAIDPLLAGIEKLRSEADRCLRNVYAPEACRSSSKWPIKRH